MASRIILDPETLLAQAGEMNPCFRRLRVL